jgi:hypothetical protein
VVGQYNLADSHQAAAVVEAVEEKFGEGLAKYYQRSVHRF